MTFDACLKDLIEDHNNDGLSIKEVVGALVHHSVALASHFHKEFGADALGYIEKDYKEWLRNQLEGSIAFWEFGMEEALKKVGIEIVNISKDQ